MMKTYILDTNVLLSDPNAINSFEDNEVVLPFIVIEELDRHKDRADEVGRNAREISRKLKALFKTKGDSWAVGTGGTLRVLSVNQVTDKAAPYAIPEELQDHKGDNIIIKFCKEFVNTHPGQQVILVTRDTILGLKATALGIVYEDYKKMNVSDGKSRDSLYSGMATIEIPGQMDEYYQEAAEFVLPEELTADLHPNQALILKDGDKSALARFVGQGKPVRKIGSSKVACKINSKNKEQAFALDMLLDPNVQLVTIAGKAGCGKSLLSIAAGLEQVLDKRGPYKSLVVCRPVMPLGKDIGYLPGTLEEKMEPWIAPIKDNLRFLFGEHGKKGKQTETTLDFLFENGTIEIQAMTYIRGRSISNAYLLIDESQNLTAHELKTIITRVGENTKIVLTGDIEQIDAMNVDSASNGLSIAIDKFKDQEIAGHITLVRGERSKLATIASDIL